MRRIVAPELMDDPAVDVCELAHNFVDIERANRFFGSTRAVIAHAFAAGAGSVLDVCCGSADIPRAFLQEARRRGKRLEVTALDSSVAVLDIARERSRDEPGLRFLRGDACTLPFEDRSFDVVSCSLALHHFEPARAVTLLRELRRVARVRPLVCDLVRSRSAYFGAVLFARILARNRLTRHDAPLSVRRAYTAAEAGQLARAAGWQAPEVRRLPFFRMLLTDRA